MKVKDFKGFMSESAAINEMDSEYSEEGTKAGMQYGANPEGEDMEEGDMEEGGVDTDEELTIEDLKAMVDDLTERVEALEPKEEEGEEGDMEESEEGDMEEEK